MRRRTAAAGLLALILASAPASAALPFDPTARGIDRVCNAYVPAAAARDVVTLARLATHDGTPPRWQRTNPAADARAQAAATFSGGDFATVVFERGSVVFADTVHIDAAVSQTQTRAWCFIGGKLSRATSENVDAATSFGWRRTSYYGDDLEKPLSEDLQQITGNRPADRRQKAPLDDLEIDAVATPAQLSFYETALVAHPVQVPKKRT